jgi:undecaprenyl diphosphate synthase
MNENNNIPKHIAIIMDGNGRWAERQGLTRTQGHLEGINRVDEIVEIANNMGIKVLTLFTFSTENWNRPKKEVSELMNTLFSAFRNKMKKLHENNIQFRFIGRTERIPSFVLGAINAVVNKTKNNTGLILNAAFNYGSRTEIIDAVKNIAQNVQKGNLKISDICEETISASLYTKNLPDPDLLIRTSGEMRISNFLLWQLSYAELYFTEKLWPEFNIDEFNIAIDEYQQRERRYGNVITNS